MPQYLFLIPPSEAKSPGWKQKKESLTFNFDKPYEIARTASPKDLKCQWKKYEEALSLNNSLKDFPTLTAIERYSGVMYNHIWYLTMSREAKAFFDQYFLIVSGMYGLLKPQDWIGNYKLPIEAKGLYQYWGEKIIEKLILLKPKTLYNLLPRAYEKLLCLKKYQSLLAEKGIAVVHPNFSSLRGEKLTHNTKILRGDWIRNVCEQQKILL